MPLVVFVSHSVESNELKIVNHLAASLMGAGVGTYLALYDRQPSMMLSTKVQQRIGESDVVLVLLSRGGNESAWVQQEVGFALGRGKRVLALVEKGVKPQAMLQGVEYFEFDPADPTGGVNTTSMYLAWLKSQNELAIARARAQQAQAQAQQAAAVAGAIATVGIIALVIWALTRD